jgi:polysaccharide deacetylase family protein (PEP-CTERM system associated)
MSFSPNTPSQHRHILSVDVEDYFQVEAFADDVDTATWETWPSRVEANTNRVLDLFARHQVNATFFFVGWVADHFPQLVRRALADGHEVACHSYGHQAIYRLTPEQFREDTAHAMDVVQQAGGVRVEGYRAPSWSITRQSLWALNILQEFGFRYDSSIFPIHHDLYGVPGASRFPYVHVFPDGSRLPEFPPTTVRFAGATLPAAGGGYLRVLPLAYTDWAFRQIESANQKVVVYFHPWELDPNQPRIRTKLKSRFRHYSNLDDMQSRITHLLENYAFVPFRDVVAVETDRLTPRLAA